MRFTRLSNLIVSVGVGSVVSCVIVSCASTEDTADSAPAPEAPDSGPPSEPDAAPAVDATDAATDETDAARIHPDFDASRPPIACESDACAKSLTTAARFWDNSFPGAPWSAWVDATSFCALLSDETVACWGSNSSAQLGRGEAFPWWGSATPARVPGLTNIVQLEGTCAVDKEGSAWCWGFGAYRNLDMVPTPTLEHSPIRLDLPPVKKVVMGVNRADGPTGCAILEDGGVVCWGANINGVVPATDIGRNSILPLQPVALPPGRQARDIGVGVAALALLDDGSLVSWGDTPTLGRPTSLAPNPHPGDVAITGIVNAFSVTKTEGCAAAWGAGYCWGAGTDLTITDPRTFYPRDNLERALPTPIVVPEPIREVSTSGSRNQGCAIGESGAVYCWGDNTYGQVGDGTKTYAAKPVQVSGLPAKAVEVKAAGDTTCVLLVNGKIYCWGGDEYGQLGAGAFYKPSVLPQEVTLP